LNLQEIFGEALNKQNHKICRRKTGINFLIFLTAPSDNHTRSSQNTNLSSTPNLTGYFPGSLNCFQTKVPTPIIFPKLLKLKEKILFKVKTPVAE
jgi:hypothetical protein